jgi:glutathione reductase (NADPH)
MSFDFDLLVIGGGSAGLAAAKRAAKYNVRVAIVEQSQLGGTCVNQGCISKKLMVYAADFATMPNKARDYGWSIEAGKFDWQRFVAVRDQEIRRLRQVQADSLTHAGIETIRGQAAFFDAHTVEVGDRKLTADKILIAVGGEPVLPDLPGIEHVITSNEIFNLNQLPQRIAIVGSGYIGVEFASILRSFGTEVTLMDQEDRLLKGFDHDLQTAVQNGLNRRGIKSLFKTTVKKIEQQSQSLQLTLVGDCPGALTVDTVLFAIGRTPSLGSLNLDQAEVKVEGKAIAVNEYSQTSQANIFAIGDCTNRLPLTPVARAEGQAFAETEFGSHTYHLDYEYVPTAVFSRPEAAAIGMTEAKAREAYGDEAVRCYQTEFQPLFDSLRHHAEKSMLKLVVRQPSNQVLGAHLVTAHAAEIIQGIAIAVKYGITKQDFDNMIGIHPTSAEEFFSNF